MDKVAGSKDNFYIPKLELLLSFTRAICKNGGLIQYSADVSERLLITHCKHPFERINKGKNFTEQVVRILDREEAMRQFDVYMLLRSSNMPLINAIYDEEEAVTATDPTYAWVARALPEEQWQIHLPVQSTTTLSMVYSPITRKLLSMSRSAWMKPTCR
jgi:hypothetical protein